MGTIIFRVFILMVFAGIFWFSWDTAGWIIQVSSLSGVIDPGNLLHGLLQPALALSVLTAIALTASGFNWLVVERPRLAAKKSFWAQRGKTWPR